MTRAATDLQVPDSASARRWSVGWDYLGAVIGMGVVAAIRMGLNPWLGEKAPFAIFYVAIAHAAWRGSIGPALVSLVLGGITAFYLFVPPSPGWKVPTIDQRWSLGVFLFTGAVIILLGITHRRSERKEREAVARYAERENAMARLLARMSDAFMIFDREWRYVYVNEQAVRLAQRPREELIGQVVWDLFPENLGTIAHQELLRCLRDQVPVKYEVFVPRIQLWVEVRAYPSGDSISLFASDVSERKRAEQVMQESAAHNRAILESALDGIITIDKTGKIGSINPAAERQFGYSAQELVGRNVSMLMPSPYNAEHDQYLRDYLQTGHRKIIGIGREVVGLRKDKSTFPMDLSVSELRIGGREIFIGLIHDITDRKEAEQQRERLLANERVARSEAEHASRMKDEFLATVSHELRTPLNAILGWAQLLRVPRPGAEDLRQGLETMERNARLQARLIDDLLDMSRIISGQLRLDVGPVKLAEVIKAAIESVQLAAEAKQIEIQCQFSDAVGVIEGDVARLQQVVWNLLTNAIKFTPRDGRVKILLEPAPRGTCLSVTDTGIGIKAEFMAHLFERFRQADGSTTRRHGGLGLGLAIARHLVELHGGKLEAASEGENRGSTFVVYLPRGGMTLSAKGGTAPVEQTVHEPAPASAISLVGIKVLVVDDEPDALNVIARLLGEYQAQVATAGSAAEAMKLIQQSLPDVLISDIGMPDEDGYAFLMRLRALPASQGGSIPAVALTAFARDEDRTRAVQCGYHAHLSKPVEAHELARHVAVLVNRHVRRA